MKHLKRHLGRVAVQRGRVDALAVVFKRLRLLHHQQRGGLRQVAVEQLVQLVAHIEPGQYRYRQPDGHHHRQHHDQQPALQRTRRPDHDLGKSRCSM